jgi:DNA-binding winged helix-turn-helix (wHTH) protein
MPSVYRIGDLVLDTGRQELRRGGEPIHLGRLSYRFLLALVDGAPNVVSHDALIDAVWGGRAASPEIYAIIRDSKP